MIDGLEAALADLAARGGTVGYGDLARQLSVPGPGAIHRLTRALEDLMSEDAAADRPFRAVLCHARTDGTMPAPGFFAAAALLGRPMDATGAVQRERDAIRRAVTGHPHP